MEHYNGDDLTWLQTFTGLQFWPLDPRVDQINIEDIAHALSLKCRFAGHCICFYSVAEHSYRVANVIKTLTSNDPKLTLTALLHDAAEAYTADVVRPVKKFIKQFGKIEHNLEKVISERFNLIFPFPETIKWADTILLATESRDLMCSPPKPWNFNNIKPIEKKIIPWSWDKAEKKFLEMYNEIINRS